MAHSIPPLLELKHPYNKVIRYRKTRQRTKTNMPRDFKSSRDMSSFMPNIDGEVLEKPIQVYRMWYRYLQLALELEEQKVHIVTKMESVPLKKPKKDKWGKLRKFTKRPVKVKIKVNRSKYKDWDLDMIPETTFNDWWFGNKGDVAHRELFYPPERAVDEVKSAKDFINDSNYVYLRIDKRRRVKDIERQIRNWLMHKHREVTTPSSFPVIGDPNINTLINRYNAMILQLTTTMTDGQMLDSQIFRPTRYKLDTSKDGTEKELHDMEKSFMAGEGAYFYAPYQEGRTMADLMRPSKIALLSVCDGYFVRNPNKKYL